MSDIEIKTVNNDDADFLYQLMNNTQIINALNEIPTNQKDWIEAVTCWENDEDELDYIIWSDNRRIGWFAFNGIQSPDKTVYLKMAAILPEYQHRGIGEYVLSQLIEAMKTRGMVNIILFTNQENIYAQKCYQKCGFKMTKKLTQQMSDDTIAARYKMECRL